MRKLARYIFYALVAAGMIALVIYAAKPMPVGPVHNDHPLYDTEPSVSCNAVCAKLAECESGDFNNRCDQICNSFYSNELRSCLMQTECADFDEDCFKGGGPEGDCLWLCEDVEQCGVMDFAECIEKCVDFSQEDFSCIEESECDQIQDRCFAGDEHDFCTSFCLKMGKCGEVDLDGMYECGQACAELDAAAVECVLKAECEHIQPYCFEPNPRGECGEYCAMMTECGFWEAGQTDDCVEFCKFEPMELILCALEAGCQAQSICYENPFSYDNCEEYCGKLVDCGFFEPWAYLECWDGCRLEYPQTVWCVVEQPCDLIQASCFENSFDHDCVVSCNKLNLCGLEDFVDVCVAECTENWAYETIDCVIENECDLILDNCTEDRQEENCALACEKLENCMLDKEATQCNEQCEDTWDADLIECVLSSQCTEMIIAPCIQ